MVAGYFPPEKDPPRLAETDAGTGQHHRAVRPDVADFADCERAVAQITEEFGSVDILVNCAGITRDGTLKKMPEANWKAVIATPGRCAFNVTRHVINGMLDKGWGRIINIASVNGQRGQFSQTNYSAAKAGCTDSPWRWHWRPRRRALPSTRSRRATSPPR